MIYLKRKDTTNGIESEVLYRFAAVHEMLFCPDVEQVALIEFKTHGKTYAERRENLRQLAVDFSHVCNGDLSVWEVNDIITWFEKNGRRYGLIREFRENAII